MKTQKTKKQISNKQQLQNPNFKNVYKMMVLEFQKLYFGIYLFFEY
jgi:hypothetical protein